MNIRKIILAENRTNNVITNERVIHRSFEETKGERGC